MAESVEFENNYKGIPEVWPVKKQKNKKKWKSKEAKRCKRIEKELSGAFTGAASEKKEWKEGFQINNRYFGHTGTIINMDSSSLKKKAQLESSSNKKLDKITLLQEKNS